MAKKYKIEKIAAKSISYGSKRNRNNVRYIVIHYTGNAGDTARGNCLFFKNWNTRSAGAHFFVDKRGNIVKSINMNRIAWSVGGFFTKKNGAGSLYGICTNANSVSIELCDCLEGTNLEQEEAVRWLVKYIRKYCPNATNIVRHWDVNGKCCPAPMTGKNNKKWNAFKKYIQG